MTILKTIFGLLCFCFLLTTGCHLTAAPIEINCTLNWTAPGDNGNVGTASQYDLRFNTIPITGANWASSTRIIVGVPTPSLSGTPETAVITFLAESETTIYFAIKTADEVLNWSPLSNVVSYRTPDIVPPAAIIDLR